jgi:hypothetical protein
MVATVNFSVKKRIKYSMWGVLPVPPTVIFPTLIIGIAKLLDFIQPQSKNLFRVATMLQYKNEKGNKYQCINYVLFLFNGLKIMA